MADVEEDLVLDVDSILFTVVILLPIIDFLTMSLLELGNRVDQIMEF